MEHNQSPFAESIEDIMEDPHKFGIPTLEEYTARPDFYRALFFGRDDQTLALADQGSSLLGAYIQKHIYDVAGNRTSKIEEAETMMLDLGWDLKNVDMEIHLLPSTSFKGSALIKLVPKKTKDQGKSKDANSDKENSGP